MRHRHAWLIRPIASWLFFPLAWVGITWQYGDWFSVAKGLCVGCLFAFVAGYPDRWPEDG